MLHADQMYVIIPYYITLSYSCIPSSQRFIYCHCVAIKQHLHTKNHM